MKQEHFNELRESLKEVLADLRGEPTGMRITTIEPPTVDVRAVRAKLGVSQPEMAALLGVSKFGLQKWEQGARRPRGAALTLLQIADAEPETVLRVMRGNVAAASKGIGKRVAGRAPRTANAKTVAPTPAPSRRRRPA